jgi:hypothetical protein
MGFRVLPEKFMLPRLRFFSQVLSLLFAMDSFLGAGAIAPSQSPPKIRKISPALRTLPLTEFYDSPDPLPAGRPGELIRFERFDGYRLSSDFQVFRILYHSRSPAGRDVAVSGVVLLPDGQPPSGGWPVIAWAHSFTGSARACAPSLLKNLNEGPLLSMYVSAGFAVVASDYAGLGTNSPHSTLDMSSNAVDVVNSIPAARAALPQLGARWLTAGYAAGGLVSVGVSEAESEFGDVNYLGALAISGVANPQELYPHLAQGSSRTLLVFLAAGVKTVFPDFRVSEILTEQAMPIYQYINHGCDISSMPQPSANEMLKPGWEENRFVKDFFLRNSLGGRPAGGPLLLLSGDAEVEVPPSLTASVVMRLCAQKDRVLSIRYPGLNASAVIVNSANEQFSWLRARFARLPAPSNCPQSM